MAEYSISSEDDERVNAPTTSTPLLEITYVRRRKRHLKNYLAGASRVAVHIDRDLQRSLSSNEGSVLSEEDIPADMAAKRQKTGRAQTSADCLYDNFMEKKLLVSSVTQLILQVVLVMLGLAPLLTTTCSQLATNCEPYLYQPQW